MEGEGLRPCVAVLPLDALTPMWQRARPRPVAMARVLA
jgi:hypothetical protein